MSGNGRCILIADDSPTVRALLEESLTEEGYEVVSACDGAEALARLYERIPDLVLLDIEMPRMNGYQVLRLLREDPLVKNVPVIFLTSKGEKSDRFWGLAVGADAYLVKDADSWMLLGKIKDLLPETSGVSPEQPEPRRTAPVPTADELLERVNMLLDRKLFQATLTHELNKLACRCLPLKDAVNGLFQLLGKVCDFHLAHLRLSSGELISCKAGALGLDFNKQAEDRFKEACEKRGWKFDFVEQMDYELSDVSMRTRGIPKAVQSWTEIELIHKNAPLALLVLASGRPEAFRPEIDETLSIFGSGASLVLDAALRERELDRSQKAAEALKQSQQQETPAQYRALQEVSFYNKLATAVLDALRGKTLTLPEPPENSGADLKDLIFALESELSARGSD